MGRDLGQSGRALDIGLYQSGKLQISRNKISLFLPIFPVLDFV